MPTIDPSSGRFRPSNSTKNFNMSMDKIEQFFADSVSFDARLSFEEPSTITMSCVDTGWSASVDASKDGWAVRLLEKAETHDEDYMSDYLDRNSDFSDYRASRKTATGEMSEADLTLDGEWGFMVEVAEDLGGTIHPFDKYQGPYIMYKGNKFWLVT
jgi:hypothetical protein